MVTKCCWEHPVKYRIKNIKIKFLKIRDIFINESLGMGCFPKFGKSRILFCQLSPVL